MVLDAFKMSKDVLSLQNVASKENVVLMAARVLKPKKDVQILFCVKRKDSVALMAKNALPPMKDVKTQKYARNLVGVGICLDRKTMNSRMVPVFVAAPVVENRQNVQKKDSVDSKMALVSPIPKVVQTLQTARSTVYANTNPLLVVFNSEHVVIRL